MKHRLPTRLARTLVLSVVAFVVLAATASATVTFTPASMPNVTAWVKTGGHYVVQYPTPTAQSTVLGPLSPGCTPASLTGLPVGDNLVSCTATGFEEEMSPPGCTLGELGCIEVPLTDSGFLNFHVHVLVDNTPPHFVPHPAMVVHVHGHGSTTVRFKPPVAHDGGHLVGHVTCAPASGSVFHQGVTAVACDQTDAAGNVGITAFTVTLT
jgi:hypothetical protein